MHSLADEFPVVRADGTLNTLNLCDRLSRLATWALAAHHAAVGVGEGGHPRSPAALSAITDGVFGEVEALAEELKAVVENERDFSTDR